MQLRAIEGKGSACDVLLSFCRRYAGSTLALGIMGFFAAANVSQRVVIDDDSIATGRHMSRPRVCLQLSVNGHRETLNVFNEL